MVDILHLAWLSRLRLSEDEKRELESRLDTMRQLIDSLLSVSVTDVEPLYHPLEAPGKLRDDVVVQGLRREDALRNAARVEDGYVVAPRTVDE